jgi:hypothetical protein
VDLAGWSLQYAFDTGSTWLVTPLSGTIAPGGYYLVQEGVGTDLPVPDATGTAEMSTTGKVALVSSTTPLAGQCPLGAPVVDFVGIGGSATCSSGGGLGPAPAPGTSTALFRRGEGCVDTDDDSADFTVSFVAPRNGQSPAWICGSPGSANNESGNVVEVVSCQVSYTSSMTVQAGATTPSVYGEIFDSGVTEASGPSPQVTAQLGWGPATANPEWEPGWSWFPASFDAQFGFRDEYVASFTAPAPGSYRYAYRFSVDGGLTWTYCDAALGDNGAGSNPGRTFDLGYLPVLTVTP